MATNRADTAAALESNVLRRYHAGELAGVNTNPAQGESLVAKTLARAAFYTRNARCVVGDRVVGNVDVQRIDKMCHIRRVADGALHRGVNRSLCSYLRNRACLTWQVAG